MKNKKTSRIIDFILLLISTVSFGAFIYFVYNIKLIPLRLRIGAIAVIAIMFLLILALFFKKLEKTKKWVYRGSMVILTAFVITGSFYSYKASSAVKETTSIKDGYMVISVVTKEGSSLSKEKDLKNKTVGLQDSHDKENADFGKIELNKVVSNVSYAASDNYVSLSNQLDNGEIDAMIIPATSAKNLDGIKGDGYSDSLKVITSFQKKMNITKNNSNTKDLTKEPFTVLLSGIDSADTGIQSTLSDVNMILIVNPQSNHIEMVSFPRDAYVPNLALGGGLDKLTHLNNDGTQNIMDSLAEIVGFDIDFYIQVNFTSVLQIVDALNGIVVDVPITVSEQDSNRKAQMVQLTEGPQQTLNGEQALALARHRASYGDVERTKTQQNILKAIISKLATKDGALNAPELLDIIGKYIKTDISEDQINNFVSYELDHLGPWSLGNTTLEHGAPDMMTTASMGSTPLSCYILNFDDVERLYQTYLMVTNPMAFSQFKFDLNDTYKDLPKLKRSSKALFTDDYYTPASDYPVDDGDDYEYEEPEYNNNNNNNNNVLPGDEVTPPTTPEVVDPEVPTPPVEPPVVPVEPVEPQSLPIKND